MDAIFPIVQPYPNRTGLFDVTDVMNEKKMKAIDMFIMAEDFFTSMGLMKMKPHFWRYSQFQKPKNRNMSCLASAYDFYDGKDYSNPEYLRSRGLLKEREVMDEKKKYQGLCPPVKRTEKDFDIGAKHHIAFNVEYFRRLLREGKSKPWHEILSIFSNNTYNKLDSSAMLEYFEPLKQWLKKQNKGVFIGWKSKDLMSCPR
ncbi:angiotensin-converting enzyme [Caerostris extrusa]|uniref:Angiotensin-converting enzyme n=1 Tax=Caerostris extrusa TaxID=172846 RepID=A0AAV4Y6I0_CAEEX|nr:angiotensin-converting enzyme [Caerostris extrusa]